MSKKNEKVIRVALRNGDDTKVKVDFHGGVFSPEEFTSLWMAVLETYTVGLLEKNSKEKVFEHWNNILGIFLNKIVPESDHYKLSKSHKKFKKDMDKILNRPETDEDKKWTEDVKFAAYLLTGDILQKELGMTAESANIIINRRLGLISPRMEKKDDKAK